MKKSIKDYQLKNKKVIIRCDFNVPMKDGKITDDNRIVQSLPTIEYATGEGAKVILMSHLGKVKTEEDKKDKSLKPVSKRLEELLNKKVVFVNETRGKKLEKTIENMNNGDIVLIENTRFEDIDGKKESSNNEELANYWASLGDIFINDAFGTSHRAHASNVGIASHLDSGVGLLVEKELEILNPAVDDPENPFVVILGGSKVSDKINVIENLVEMADYILIGGGMCNTFLKAEGFNVGNSLVDNDNIDFCSKILEKYDNKIILPVDLVVNTEFKDTKGKIKDITNISDEDISMDIGPKTIELFSKYIKDAKQIIWNGPMGVFEFKNYQNGTKEICDIISKNNGTTIIGGGDSAAAAIKFGYKDKFTHISTGGGASLELLEGKILPGIDIITDRDIFKDLKKKNYIILISILIIILYLVLKDNFMQVMHQLTNLKIPFLLLALASMGIYGLLRALSLHLVIKDFKKDFKFFDTAKNLIITQFFNGITPFSTGGQPAQIYFLKNQDIPIPVGTSIIIQNFIVYQIILVFYGFLAIVLNYFFNFFPDLFILKEVIVLGFIINTAVMVFLLFISRAKNLNKYFVNKIVTFLYKIRIVKNKVKTMNKINYTLEMFHNNSKQIHENRKTFIKCLLCNFIAFPFLYSIPIIVIMSTGVPTSLNFVTSFVACCFVMIIGAFVPIPGGSGGLEFAFARFYGNYIAGPALATSLLIWRFITYYLGMIIGAITLTTNKRR